MSSAAEKRAFTLDDFLEWEAAQPRRHEFLQGEVFAMTGASDWHNVIALNTAFCLRARTAPPCRVYMADVKLAVRAADACFYPDVFITCAEADQQRRHAKEDPLLIVEVLSPGTEAYDRGRKFEHYRRLAGLRGYLLVSQDHPHVDAYLRDDLGRWTLTDADGLDTTLDLPLPDLALTLSLAEICQDVDFSQTEATPTPEERS